MLMSAIEFEDSHVERGSVDFSFTCLLLSIYLPHLVQFRKKKKKFSCNRRLRSFNRSVASIFIKSQILLLRAYQLISTIVLVDIYQLYIIIVCLLTISFR